MQRQDVGFIAAWVSWLAACGPAVTPDEAPPAESSSTGSATTAPPRPAPPVPPTGCAATGCGEASSDDGMEVSSGGGSLPPDFGGPDERPQPDPTGCTPPVSCDQGIFDGDMTITSAEDANALAGFTALTGTLSIQSTELECLHVLSCLESVGGDLVVFDNDQLTDVTGLDNVTEIGASFERGVNEVGSLLVSENDALVDLNTFNLVEQARVTLAIAENDQLEAISGFQEFVGTQEHFEIRFHPLLTDISASGLLEVLFIGGDCVVTNNPLLDPALIDEMCDAGS